jgi:hypothetical protein
LLAETHFGATWPFFVDKVNFGYIKDKKINFIILPLVILIFCLFGFIFFKNTFFLIFFAANMYHVTRQSFGICKLYTLNNVEKKFQEHLIYFFNLLFFMVAFLRFYVPIINLENLMLLNLTILALFLIIFIYYIYKFKFSENFLTFVTGSIIFYPVCFVLNPVHAIIMGVTMHYTQYLYLTHHVYKSRKNESSEPVNNIFFNKYFITIIGYSVIMTFFSTLGKFDQNFYKQLIIIPIIGQMLHFYLDSQLWKFSEKHNRENILKYINELKNKSV